MMSVQALQPRIRPRHLSSAEEIIDAARNGRMVIIVDDEDRENEGDLIIPAQMATPDVINFMAKHGRGLICLALTSARAEALGLEAMSRDNRTRHATAFTVSIEAKDGVTTGISAADRARTISVAINAADPRDHIVSPGHVFPLVAREGGVLIRAGHTEAAVDIARLAGLNASGVICEIMNDDGSMARLDDLIDFAAHHDLKIGTIRDLIAYRRRHDHLVVKRGQMRFESRFGGAWTLLTYFNTATGEETAVLQKGVIDPDKPTLVRMHMTSFMVDMLGEVSERADLLSRSMDLIAAEGAGVIVIINDRSTDMVTRIIHARSAGSPDAAARHDDLRTYGGGAQILSELGVEDMILLTNTHHALIGLDGYGLSIVGERPILTDASQGCASGAAIDLRSVA